MGRFLAVAAGQMVSMTGTALTEFAIPLWVYLQTGSLVRFTLFALVALVPGLIAAPLIGALVDRGDRRRALLAAASPPAPSSARPGVPLLVTGSGSVTSTAAGRLSVALTVQRLAYGSAVPQLVPKRYMGTPTGSCSSRRDRPVPGAGVRGRADGRVRAARDPAAGRGRYVAATAVAAGPLPPDAGGAAPRGPAGRDPGGFSSLGRPGFRAMLLFFGC